MWDSLFILTCKIGETQRLFPITPHSEADYFMIASPSKHAGQFSPCLLRPAAGRRSICTDTCKYNFNPYIKAMFHAGIALAACM